MLPSTYYLNPPDFHIVNTVVQKNSPVHFFCVYVVSRAIIYFPSRRLLNLSSLTLLFSFDAYYFPNLVDLRVFCVFFGYLTGDSFKELWCLELHFCIHYLLYFELIPEFRVSCFHFTYKSGRFLYSVEIYYFLAFGLYFSLQSISAMFRPSSHSYYKV